MATLLQRIERLLFRETTEEAAARRAITSARLVNQRVEQRIIAALELPDEAHRCLVCNGEGYVLADDRIHEALCAVCDGSGLRAIAPEA